MPVLVVSDASVVIDMVNGGLAMAMFAMPLTFAVPDIMFDEELEPYIPGLREMGLQILEIQSEGISYIDGLIGSGRSLPGAHDLYALALARQERCLLLTTDKRLRRLAEEEQLAVHGTLWLVKGLMDSGLVSKQEAREAFQLMLDSGSYLPHAGILELVQ